MSILKTLGRIVKTAVEVVLNILPLMDLLRQLIPSIGGLADQIDELIDQGEEVADDFIDENITSFMSIREFAVRLEIAGEGMKLLIDEIIASAEDDKVTVEEMQAIYASLREAIVRVQNAGDAAAHAMKAAEKLKNA